MQITKKELYPLLMPLILLPYQDIGYLQNLF